MTHSSSFDIQTPADFFTKVVIPQYNEFIEDNASSRKALLAIIVAYHMFEWANNHPFKKQDTGLPPEIDDMFDIARNITNGTKHFEQKIVSRTQVGFSSAFSDAFACPLIVMCNDNSELSVDKLLRALVEYWESEKASSKF